MVIRAKFPPRLTRRMGNRAHANLAIWQIERTKLNSNLSREWNLILLFLLRSRG